MEIAVLGPVRAHAHGAPVDLGTPRQRAILAALALADGRTVPADTVIARVWGESPPPGALATLHGYIGALRRVLEPERAPRSAPRVLVTDGRGYALRIARTSSDAGRLEQAVAQARSLLQAVPDHLRPRVASTDTEQVVRAVAGLDDALALWRGLPYVELGDDPVAVAERVRLADLLTAGQELRVVALLALGRHDEVVPELASMTAGHPLHERWWALHAVALARSGRQADALASLATLRDVLADELGVDPSAQVRDLHLALLRQDPSVGWAETAARATGNEGHELDLVPTPARRTRFRESPPLPRWPMAGRGEERERLDAVLQRALTGHPQVGLVTGEAGVGKSRLVLEAAATAFAQGYVVATGQCSLDGPPPLWPWRMVLSSLAQQTGSGSEVVDALDTLPPDDFGTWDTVARVLCEATATVPLLVVLEDVQWADAATQRLLTHLMSVARNERLCVLVTLRLEEGTDLALTAPLARHEGARVDLTGLPLADAATLVTTVAETLPEADLLALWQRTGGNPFFLSELALSDGRLSGSLSDVVRSRVRSLPPDTSDALEAASVIDVVFDLDLLAWMLDAGLEEARRRLAPAIEAGLVSDGGRLRADFHFSHGVVREVLNAGLPHAARARWHRQVASTLERHTGLARVELRSALVHHWELAGYEWVGEAWRSTLRAAEVARSASAYDEEARLLGRALAWQEADLASGPAERFELLMMLADAARWSADWQAVSDAVDEAIAVAERLGSPELAARAAISTMEGALWQARPFGTVHAPIIEALERVLRRLPEEQTGLRCRAQLALAMELFYGGDVARIDELVAGALAIAEDSEDLRLQTTAYLGAFAARSRPDTAPDRVVYAHRAREASERLDDVRSRLLAETLSLSVASELGRADVVREHLPRVLQLTRARGLATAEAVLRAIEVPWLVMSGEDVAAGTSLDRLVELAQTLRMPNLVDAAEATQVAATILAGDPGRLLEMLASFVDRSEVPAGHMAVVVLLRSGQVDLARAMHAGQVNDLSGHTFMALMNACLACEVAAGLGDRDLAAQAYPLALPYAGRMCSAGSAAAFGPVDGFLALGASAMGDHEAAAAHAAAAVALAREWGVPRVEEELARSRERYAR